MLGCLIFFTRNWMMTNIDMKSDAEACAAFLLFFYFQLAQIKFFSHIADNFL